MSDDNIQSVREFLGSLPDRSNLPLEENRALYDRSAEFFPLKQGVSVEGVETGSVSGEWVKAPGALDDAALLYLHGGGYVTGSPLSHRHLAAAISDAAGVPVFSLAYRLAPENPFPAAVEDALAAYRYLLERGFLPSRLGVAGDSAGGGLALALMVSLRDAGDQLPGLGICLSPWVDLTGTAESYKTKAETDPVVDLQRINEIARAYLAGKDPKTPLASPLFADLSGLPRLLIQVGREEMLLDDSIGLNKKAREAGVDSTLEIWEEMIHVWHWFHPMLKEGREAIARIGEFFKDHIE